MSYNVLSGGRGREDLVLAVLRALSADIVVLQEIFDEKFAARLGMGLDMHHFLARGNTKHHLALLSRWPITDRHSYHPFPPVQQTVLEATIDTPGGPVHVFGVHPVPLPLVLLELWRLWEITVALKRIGRREASACLLMGDFNASAPGDRPMTRRLGILSRFLILLQGQRIYRFSIRAILEAGMVDCFRTLNPDSDGFTYGPPSPVGRIDYIFASATMKRALTGCFVAREPAEVDRASDHYPLVADFRA